MCLKKKNSVVKKKKNTPHTNFVSEEEEDAHTNFTSPVFLHSISFGKG
jgi:hypothetical protein